MPNVECLVTLNDRLLMIEGGPGMDRLLPIHGAVRPGESPLAACAREVHDRTGFHVSPSCAGVVYAAEDAEHDYTLVFVADAPAGSDNLAGTPLRWVDLHGFRHHEQVPSSTATSCRCCSPPTAPSSSSSTATRRSPAFATRRPSLTRGLAHSCLPSRSRVCREEGPSWEGGKWADRP